MHAKSLATSKKFGLSMPQLEVNYKSPSKYSGGWGRGGQVGRGGKRGWRGQGLINFKSCESDGLQI